jgi:hypothetical protein
MALLQVITISDIGFEGLRKARIRKKIRKIRSKNACIAGEVVVSFS